MSRQKQELSDILNKLELTQQDRMDLEYYIKYGADVATIIEFRDKINKLEQTVERIIKEINIVELEAKINKLEQIIEQITINE